jgi:hypothetical protein
MVQIMQENYEIPLASHAGNGEHGGDDGHDGDFVRGMFQEPIFNCPGVYTQTRTPPPWFRSLLWLSAVTGSMPNQLIFLLSPDTPLLLRDEMEEWSLQAVELMPSLFAKFGQRDSVLAAVQSVESPGNAEDLRVRAWAENRGCVHLVAVNTNTSRPAQCTMRLSGGIDGLVATTDAHRLFEGRSASAYRGVVVPWYTVPLSFDTDDEARLVRDWLGPGQTNVYRLGENCTRWTG